MFPRSPLSSQPSAHLSAATKTLAGGLGPGTDRPTGSPGPTQFPVQPRGPTPLEAEGPRSPGERSQAAYRGCRGAEVGQKPTSLPNSHGPWTCPQTPAGLTWLGPAHHDVSRGKAASSPSWEGWGSLTPGRHPAVCSRPRRTHTGRRAAWGSPGGFSRRRADPPLQEQGRVSRAPRTGAAPQTHSRAGHILGWDKLGPTPAQTPATLQARAAPGSLPPLSTGQRTHPQAKSRPQGQKSKLVPSTVFRVLGLARPPPCCRSVPPFASYPAHYPILSSALGRPS